MSLSKAVTIDWCSGSHKSVNTLISREPATTTPFTAWEMQMDKPPLHKWGADWKLTLNEVWKSLKIRVFPGSVNATKSGSGLLKLQKYQADSVNVCQHIKVVKFNLQALSLFQEPNLQSTTKWQGEGDPSQWWKLAETSRDRTSPRCSHRAHADVLSIYSLFPFLSTPPTTLHSMGNTAWEWLPARCWTSTAPAAPRGHQSENPSAEGSATPSMDFFPSKQLAITGKCTLIQGRRFINDWSKGILCSTALCPFHFTASL